jgi:hypothetical protein
MNPKIILAGYPGSQKIVPASKYLNSKYLPGFDITYLNYKGPIDEWSDYVAGFLKYLTDEKVIFALDDYLVSGPIDMEVFKEANEALGGSLINAKLCECSEQDQREYPCTTQYTIWDREFLIQILSFVKTPWQFELDGSKILTQVGGQTILRPCIPYFTNSSLSGRWEGVNFEGLKEEDLNYIKEKWTTHLKL